jgi:hypothetical protein
MSKTSMHWNHRLVRVKDGSGTVLMLCEVFYDGIKAIGRNEGARVFGDSVADCRTQLDRMYLALDRPILSDRWPQSSLP